MIDPAGLYSAFICRPLSAKPRPRSSVPTGYAHAPVKKYLPPLRVAFGSGLRAIKVRLGA